ncbi:hypothetical protein P153DRAFT_364127 [Dothidotthia symphoricarpi CBS 119687]|uniref:Aminoglycoside phosphotransferase domain-containing protein n=1 Tax=Dothidotthia symphoricarpi CBS 119687 TaxID=1392245 RepID=A0A6A6ANZ7_9PLEO|nr:uncharacterized protein P153DRAFT_364127 [Dothidotthia symphoricarpi CBS 119687]KAF2132868.1 hypothetical protein P153DRAFT_364127 [Dothidotthia symphoricarpi CBS 119687]
MMVDVPTNISVPEGDLQHRIAILVSKVFDQAGPQFEDLGGSHNKVLAFTVPRYRARDSGVWLVNGPQTAYSNGPTPPIIGSDAYVVRTPVPHNSQKVDVKRSIANLYAIEPHLALPIPRVLKFDLTTNNPLGQPYVIQHRLRGYSLEKLWEYLNPKQMVSAVREITKLVEMTAAVVAPGAGLVQSDNFPTTKASVFELEKFPIPSLRDVHPMVNKTNKAATEPALPQIPIEFLIEQCDRWREIEPDACTGSEEKTWRKFIAIARSLNIDGWLDLTFHLVHGELVPKNILAVVKDSSSIEITGIVGWSSTYFAPKFEVYRAPFWAWDGQDGETIDTDPPNAVDVPLKKAFCKTASEEYIRFAFSPEAAIARRVFRVLRNGMQGKEQQSYAYDVVAKWETLHPGDNLAKFR